MAETDPGRARTAALAAAMLGVVLLAVSFLPALQRLTSVFLSLTVAAQIVAATIAVRPGRRGSPDAGRDEDPEIAALRAAAAEARQAVDDKNREMERFTYIVSHDLRSPLLTIQGFADILVMDVEEGKSEAVEEDLEHILSATARMRLLLDDLLELSRIGRFAEPASRVSLAVVVEDAIRDLEKLIGEKEADIQVQDGLPELRVDRGRIQQLFRLLLDNAVRYGRPGHAPRIEVGRIETEDGEAFFVRDDGAGLEAENLTKAFGPFERFSAESVGSGMGLALAQRIVEYHQGAIRAESDGAERGTTIYFSLGEPPPAED